MRGYLKSTPQIIGRAFSPNDLARAFEELGGVIAHPPGAGGRYKSAQDVIDDNINATRNRPVLFAGTWDMAAMPDTPTITIPRLDVRTDFCVMGLGRGQTIFQADDDTVFTFDTAGITGGQFGNFQVDYVGGGANTNYMLDIVRGSSWIIRDILVLNAHKAIEFRYQQASEIFNVFCRNPNNAVTSADSAMVRLGSYFDGAVFRRCINLNFYSLRVWSGSSGSTISHANQPRYGLDINGVDGCVLQNCHFVPAHCGVRLKSLDGMTIGGQFEISNVYIDGVNYAARGLTMEASVGGGGITNVNINGGFIGNCDITYDDGALTESISVEIDEPVTFLNITQNTRISNSNVGIDATLNSSSVFACHGLVKGDNAALRVAGGQSVSLGGRYETTSGTGVTLTGTIESVIWRGAVLDSNTTNVSNSATITYEKGFGITDDGDTYWNSLLGSGLPSAWTVESAPVGAFTTADDSTWAYGAARSLRTYAVGKIKFFRLQIQATPTYTTATGAFKITFPFSPNVTSDIECKSVNAVPSLAANRTYLGASLSSGGVFNVYQYSGTIGSARDTIDAAELPSGSEFRFHAWGGVEIA